MAKLKVYVALTPKGQITLTTFAKKHKKVASIAAQAANLGLPVLAIKKHSSIKL